ncbi:endonuclease 1-like [Chenopodium quinoa]|uniref:endonuclease 1-like n=1 Tax=Chenopodium quinoa TaxID=63459 RepID=UPI000B784AC4|nr:endonuclease 1-like [Chenopodium quinoa]
MLNKYRGFSMSRSTCFVSCLVYCLILIAGVQAWSKEGHTITCKMAQDLLEPEALDAVKKLLPDNLNGNLSALCVWPDQVRHWYKYRWTSPLHFIDTPDDSCSFNYKRKHLKQLQVD